VKDPAGSSVESTYNFLLVATSAFFLAHFVVVLMQSGRHATGLIFWPTIIVLSLSGSSLSPRYLFAFLFSIAMLLPAAVVARVSPVFALTLATATGLMLAVSSVAEHACRDGIEELANKANRLVRNLKRLQASKRQLQDQSARLRVGQFNAGITSVQRTLVGHRAVYKFQRGFLLGLLEIRCIENLAAWYRRALERIGVEQGLVVLFDGRNGRVGEAWGFDDSVGALDALLVSEGDFSLVDWIAKRRCILTQEELTGNPMLEVARRGFLSRFFVPQLIVPVFCRDEMVALVVAGKQRRGSALELTPTVLSPLLPIQESIVSVLR